MQAVHTAVKGRVRYKVTGLYRSDTLKSHLESKLSEKEGICRVSVNILTGNILVYFNSGNNHHLISLLITDIVTEYRRETSPPKPLRTEEKKKSDRERTEDRKTGRRRLRKLIFQAEEQKDKPWHLMEARDVLNRLELSEDTGLSVESVRENLKKYGPNLLPESVPRSGLSIFIDQLKSLPVLLLGIAAGISVFTGGVADALMILGVVAINAAIGYVTESQAEKTINSLKGLVRPYATVMRERALSDIRAGDVVPGDILVLRPGSYIAADARLTAVYHLSVDESTLTGESMPVTKAVEVILQSESSLQSGEIPLADRVNMVYMGTLVTGGQGIAVVVATGRFTELGRIQTLVGETTPPETPMEKQLRGMGSQLVLIGGGVCCVVFVIGLIRGYAFIQMLKISISLAVAAIPEGLPTVATTTLALGIRNMRRHHVLIRHLDAVETLGSVQTICLDKTGTITLNRMTVVSVYTGMRRMRASDGRFSAEGEYIHPSLCEELLRLITTSAICSEVEIEIKEGEYILRGSSTENALVHMAVGACIDVIKLREEYPLLKINSRSDGRNFMSTLHANHSSGKVLAVKGSPAEVLAMCNYYMKDGKEIPLTDYDRLTIEIENEQMAGEALRVLGVAYVFIDRYREESTISNSSIEPENLIWLGLIGMADPVRKGVKELIGAFHQAGIDTVMITGDQGPTAYAIGKELNLSGGEQIEILDSTHLTNIEPDALMALSRRVHIFSRVSPAHKLQIVQALQGGGRIVAMTGDGINDGPALKAADIGIAMGHTGTDVAREVADVVLEDDNLETMIIAVGHGRTIYHNIRKSVHFLLATNMSEIMVMFTAITVGLGQPLNAMQLLWINLISDIFPGLALALEPPEPDVLNRPPRNPEEPIIRAADFKRISLESATLSAGALSAYGYGIMRYGMGPRAGTMAFMSLTMGQLLHALSCRSEKVSIFNKGGVAGQSLQSNPYLNIALGGSFAFQILSMLIPGIRGILGITPVSLLDGIVIGGSSLIPLLVNERTKGGGKL